MIEYSHIKQSAIDVGFDLVGVTKPREFEFNRLMIEQWVASGAADSLSYMKQYMDIRFNPANLLEGTQSVVVCAINYKNSYSIKQCKEGGNLPKIASYALNRDYHKSIRKLLKELLRRLQRNNPHLEGRCCVDTAPLLEKQLACEAGLGWIGRQSLLVTPQFGSYVLLGLLLLTDKVDYYNSPYRGDGCGTCHRCVESCPAGAILDNRMIDSRLCISALTVECDSTDGKELNGWLFGCDECQSCCPHNQRSPMATNAAFAPIISPIPSNEWQRMTPEEFTQKVGSTPLKRGGLERIKRNCIK
ncbi:MAG: tRNA epoxyqueuosine(34) reductase QueG [Rikenellaceae bacterium]